MKVSPMLSSVPGERSRAARASAVESRIELFAERWNKVGSQTDADRLQAEIEHTAKTLAPEELLAYAAAPHLRGRLLALCVFARAQERAAQPRAGDACGDAVRAAPPDDSGPRAATEDRQR